MNQKHVVGSRVIAALLLLAIVQVSLQVGLAEPSNATSPVVVPQQVVARLTTRNNQPVTVNGLSANTGASILTGATIETGADQSATVNLGPLGSLDIAPNTKLVLTYDDQGNVKVVLVYGCAVLTAKKKTTGEIATDQGTAAKNDPAAGGILNVCFPQGATAPTVNPGVAAATGGGGGLFGLGTAATIAIFGGIGAAALTPLFFQDNPSGSNP
jgi:hypothetical protein